MKFGDFRRNFGQEGAGRGELRRLRERVRGMCAAVEAQLGGDAARHPVLAAALAGVAV